MAYHVRICELKIRFWVGMLIGRCSHEDMKDLRCMSYTSKGNSEIIVAGFQDQMFIVNVDKGTVTRQVWELPNGSLKY